MLYAGHEPCGRRFERISAPRCITAGKMSASCIFINGQEAVATG